MLKGSMSPSTIQSIRTLRINLINYVLLVQLTLLFGPNHITPVLSFITKSTPGSVQKIGSIIGPSNTLKTPCFMSASTTGTSTTSSNDSRTPEEEAFYKRTQQLCNERNLPLQKVKNARDLASAFDSPVLPNRIYRTGRLSDASPSDISLLLMDYNTDDDDGKHLGIKTLVDLRSPTELKDDATLERQEVFGNFTNLIWVERKQSTDSSSGTVTSSSSSSSSTSTVTSVNCGGIVKELNANEPRIPPNQQKKHDNKHKKKKTLKQHVKDIFGGIKNGLDVATHAPAQDIPLLDVAAAVEVADMTTTELDEDGDDVLIVLDTADTDHDDSDDHHDKQQEHQQPQQLKRQKRFVKQYSPASSIHLDSSRNSRKERHYVSLMNEMKYVRGTLSKLRKRDIARVVLQSPGAIVSKRIRNSCKDVFLSEINGGGLPMLNELVLKFGSPGIKYVLDLCADRSRHPIAFYCTAGKDRTGMIAALILAILGLPDEAIVEDYSLSANVYAEMNDHKAMVGALSQRSLNPKVFLGAPPQVMRDTLKNIREEYGSIEAYLDDIGFMEEDREKLRKALTAEP